MAGFFAGVIRSLEGVGPAQPTTADPLPGPGCRWTAPCRVVQDGGSGSLVCPLVHHGPGVAQDLAGAGAGLLQPAKAGQRIRTWQLTEPWANWVLSQPDQREEDN